MLPTAMNDAHHPADILGFIAREQAGGNSCALITVTDIYGGTLRAKGALMAVASDGKTAGYISNGCVDADIISQAQQALKTNQTRTLVYGENSPFKDIQLPCGGRIDIRITPAPDQALMIQSAQALAERKSIQLNGITYPPKLRIRIIGRGALVRSLTTQSVQSGFTVHIQSPDMELGSLAQMHECITYEMLTTPDTPPPCNDDDEWTAMVLMFHDHAWEGEILKQALSGSAFYYGALGSAHTHASRCETLKNLGVTSENIAKIRGPLGLIPGMRNANLLAISALAEIVKTAQEKGRL